MTAVVIGSARGLLLHGRFPEKIRTIVFQGLGLSTLVIGLKSALAFDNLLLLAMIFH